MLGDGFFGAHPNFPQIAMVAKEPDDTDNIGGGWHTDHSYDEEPAMGSILVARELPETGGDTCFSNMYKVFDSLSEGLQETLLGLNAVHSAKHAFGSQNTYHKGEVTGDRIGNSASADAMPDSIHPLYRVAHRRGDVDSLRVLLRVLSKCRCSCRRRPSKHHH